MATLTVTTINHATGVLDLVASATAADAALSDKWTGTGKEMLFVNNAGGSPCVVTETYGVGGTVDGVALVSRTKSVASGKSAILGPYPTGLFNDANSFMNVSYNQVATVKVLPFVIGT